MLPLPLLRGKAGRGETVRVRGLVLRQGWFLRDDGQPAYFLDLADPSYAAASPGSSGSFRVSLTGKVPVLPATGEIRETELLLHPTEGARVRLFRAAGEDGGGDRQRFWQRGQ